jgi:DNA-binding transcriptional ArsR family regulator
LSADVGAVFAALSDPTRRRMLETALRDGETSVPALGAAFPISRQALAKHLAALDHAGLLERAAIRGREVTYRPRADALGAAAAWIREAEARWDERLARLKSEVEAPGGDLRSPSSPR